jgi:AcrR family transcriptional regulator
MRFAERSDSDDYPDRPKSGDGGTPEQRERRQRILDSTLTLASSGGFDAVQMGSVADRADIPLGTLYRYYPSKIHLLISALNRALEIAHENSRCAHISGETPYERLLVKTHQITGSLHDDPQLTEAMTRALMFADATVATEVAETSQLIERMFASAMSQGGPPSTEHRAIARVISDVWLSNLVAWVSQRVTAEDVGLRLDATASLLFGRPVENAAS